MASRSLLDSVLDVPKGARLFGRVVRLFVAPKPKDTSGGIVAGFEFSALDCTFRVKKTLKWEPNTAEIRVYNIAPESRASLQMADRLLVTLEAGYPNAVCQIFRGEVRGAMVVREGPDQITNIEAGDSEREMATSHVTLSVAKNVPPSVLLGTIVRALGIGAGNTEEIGRKLDATGAHMGPGTAYFGSAADALSSFCSTFALQWSVQDGAIQILEIGRGLNATAVVLSSSTGLIGSPTIDHKGVLRARALIQPDLEPGRLIRIDGMNMRGDFRITESEFLGDTAGGDWYVDIIAELL